MEKILARPNILKNITTEPTILKVENPCSNYVMTENQSVFRYSQKHEQKGGLRPFSGIAGRQ